MAPPIGNLPSSKQENRNILHDDNQSINRSQSGLVTSSAINVEIPSSTSPRTGIRHTQSAIGIKKIRRLSSHISTAPSEGAQSSQSQKDETRPRQASVGTTTPPSNVEATSKPVQNPKDWLTIEGLRRIRSDTDISPPAEPQKRRSLLGILSGKKTTNSFASHFAEALKTHVVSSGKEFKEVLAKQLQILVKNGFSVQKQVPNDEMIIHALQQKAFSILGIDKRVEEAKELCQGLNYNADQTLSFLDLSLNELPKFYAQLDAQNQDFFTVVIGQNSLAYLKQFTLSQRIAAWKKDIEQYISEEIEHYCNSAQSLLPTQLVTTGIDSKEKMKESCRDGLQNYARQLVYSDHSEKLHFHELTRHFLNENALNIFNIKPRLEEARTLLEQNMLQDEMKEVLQSESLERFFIAYEALKKPCQSLTQQLMGGPFIYAFLKKCLEKKTIDKFAKKLEAYLLFQRNIQSFQQLSISFDIDYDQKEGKPIGFSDISQLFGSFRAFFSNSFAGQKGFFTVNGEDLIIPDLQKIHEELFPQSEKPWGSHRELLFLSWLVLELENRLLDLHTSPIEAFHKVSALTSAFSADQKKELGDLYAGFLSSVDCRSSSFEKCRDAFLEPLVDSIVKRTLLVLREKNSDQYNPDLLSNVSAFIQFQLPKFSSLHIPTSSPWNQDLRNCLLEFKADHRFLALTHEQVADLEIVFTTISTTIEELEGLEEWKKAIKSSLHEYLKTYPFQSIDSSCVQFIVSELQLPNSYLFKDILSARSDQFIGMVEKGWVNGKHGKALPLLALIRTLTFGAGAHRDITLLESFPSLSTHEPRHLKLKALSTTNTHYKIDMDKMTGSFAVTNDKIFSLCRKIELEDQQETVYGTLPISFTIFGRTQDFHYSSKLKTGFFEFSKNLSEPQKATIAEQLINALQSKE